MSVVDVSALASGSESAASDSEVALIERAKRSREAFAVLYRQNYHAIAGYVFRRTGNVHATEDLVADVFLTAMRQLPRYRCRGVPLRYWLYRVATHAANRWARRQRRQAHEPLRDALAADTPPPALASEENAEQERAQRAMLALSSKHQTALSLHYLEGLSVEEIAAVVGCRVGTVKSRLARARDALREKLQPRR